jgi:hypothetical protein
MHEESPSISKQAQEILKDVNEALQGIIDVMD